MKPFLKAALSLLLAGVLLCHCVSADRPFRQVQVSRDTIAQNSSVGYRHRAMGPGLQVEATLYLPRKLGMLQRFLESFAVDSESSAFEHFNDNLSAAYVHIHNPSSQPAIFRTNMLILENLKESKESVAPEALPGLFERTNWKGAVKNVYNASMITLATIAVIAATIYCIQENHCDGFDVVEGFVNDTGRVAAAASKSEAIFSSITHRTELSYDRLLPAESTIPPGGTVEGLVFFERLSDMETAEVKFR
ncbi:MAG: hypothetical protein HS115_18450 [Spirochaetales bacterium]|nr:hypothetical protein [Spirochaetales bacterium]